MDPANIVVSAVRTPPSFRGAHEVLMAREGYKETPKTALIYTICIAVLYLGLLALGASWLTAAAPAIFFGVILAMWAVDWLGVKEDD